MTTSLFLVKFEFKQNELYHFLNSTLKNLLKKYENTRTICEKKFKDLIIYNEIEKDKMNYS